jgi:ATP-dependent DNA ligase
MKNYYQGCAGVIDPMSIMKFDFNKSDYLVEQKYDGIYCMLTFNNNGKLSLISRNMKVKDNKQLESLRVYLENYFQLKDSVINGELAFSTQAGTEYQKLYGHSKIDIFDILKYKGKELSEETLLTRKLLLKTIIKNNDEYITLAPWICSDPKITPWNQMSALPFNAQVQQWFDKLVKEKREGLIVKDMNDISYEFGGKSKLWYKIKKLVSNDYVIMGYDNSGSKRYSEKGWIKNIICGLYEGTKLIEKVKVGSMIDSVRKEISENRKKYLKSVIEIAGFEVFKSGSIRHPSFLRFRDDKNAEDCKWERK